MSDGYCGVLNFYVKRLATPLSGHLANYQAIAFVATDLLERLSLSAAEDLRPRTARIGKTWLVIPLVGKFPVLRFLCTHSLQSTTILLGEFNGPHLLQAISDGL